LQWFRIVLLQDAVILSDMFPESPMWQMYPFRLPQFLQFKQFALQKMEEDEHPQNVQLQKTIPVIADRLLVMSQIIADGFRNVERIVQTNQETDGHLVNLIETLVTKTGEAQGYLSQLNRGAQGFIDAYKNVEGSSLQIMPQSSTDLPLSQAQLPTSNMPDMSDANDKDIAPQYIPDKNIETVEQVYEEWYEGLIGGSDGGRGRGPAMGVLEKRYKTEWRKKNYVRKRFERRRDIIQRLDKTAQRLGVSGREAARRMELWKREKKMSLDKLRNAIKANQELWGANDIELN
jgi:Transcriptional activator of glycolytic enzymes